MVRSSAVSSMPDAWIVLLLTLLEEHPEATADRAIKILEACQVEEEDFFCHVTHKTWDVILHDIRKAHENDNESAPDTTPADELIREVQKAMQSPGDRVQQFTEMFCKAFQLKYKRLSQEERSLLKKLFKKSPLIKQSGMNFRRDTTSGVGRGNEKLPLWEWVFLQRQLWLSIFYMAY